MHGAETQPHKHCWKTKFSMTLPCSSILLCFRLAGPRVLLKCKAQGAVGMHLGHEAKEHLLKSPKKASRFISYPVGKKASRQQPSWLSSAEGPPGWLYARQNMVAATSCVLHQGSKLTVPPHGSLASPGWRACLVFDSGGFSRPAAASVCRSSFMPGHESVYACPASQGCSEMSRPLSAPESGAVQVP